MEKLSYRVVDTRRRNQARLDTDENLLGAYDYHSIAQMRFEGITQGNKMTILVKAEAEDGKSTRLSMAEFMGQSTLRLELQCEEEDLECKHYAVVRGLTSNNFAGSSMENTTVDMKAGSIVAFNNSDNTTEEIALLNDSEKTGTINVKNETGTRFGLTGELGGEGVADGRPLNFKSNLTIEYNSKVSFDANLPVERFKAVNTRFLHRHRYVKVYPIECSNEEGGKTIMDIPIESSFNFSQTFGIPVPERERVLDNDIDTELRTFEWEFIITNRIISVELKSFCGDQIEQIPEFLEQFDMGGDGEDSESEMENDSSETSAQNEMENNSKPENNSNKPDGNRP